MLKKNKTNMITNLLYLLTLLSSTYTYSKTPILHHNNFIYLIVDKKNLSVDVRTLTENIQNSQSLYSLKVALGKIQGDKEKEGDHKTPEGIYLIRNYVSTKKLDFKTYGPLAISLNYPNPIDKKQNKTGSGIWLHGGGDIKRIEEAYTTRGCLTFYNEDILRLQKSVTPQQSFIVVAKNSKEVNQIKDHFSLKKALNNWLSSWQEKNIKKYASFYSPDFVHNGKKKKTFLQYKKNLFKRYKKMGIKLSMVRVITHPKYSVTLMNQDFYGDHYVSLGRKMIYWKKKKDQWTIIHEYFDSLRFKPGKNHHLKL